MSSHFDFLTKIKSSRSFTNIILTSTTTSSKINARVAGVAVGIVLGSIFVVLPLMVFSIAGCLFVVYIFENLRIFLRTLLDCIQKNLKEWNKQLVIQPPIFLVQMKP